MYGVPVGPFIPNHSAQSFQVPFNAPGLRSHDRVTTSWAIYQEGIGLGDDVMDASRDEELGHGMSLPWND